MKTLPVLLALVLFAGCDSARQQEIASIEDSIDRLDRDIASVNDGAAAGTIAPEAAAERIKALVARQTALRKRLEALRAQPTGIGILEAVLIAAATALGLRGAPTGGLGGIAVNLVTGLFRKREEVNTEPTRGTE